MPAEIACTALIVDPPLACASAIFSARRACTLEYLATLRQAEQHIRGHPPQGLLSRQFAQQFVEQPECLGSVRCRRSPKLGGPPSGLRRVEQPAVSIV